MSHFSVTSAMLKRSSFLVNKFYLYIFFQCMSVGQSLENAPCMRLATTVWHRDVFLQNTGWFLTWQKQMGQLNWYSVRLGLESHLLGRWHFQIAKDRWEGYMLLQASLGCRSFMRLAQVRTEGHHWKSNSYHGSSGLCRGAIRKQTTAKNFSQCIFSIYIRIDLPPS